MSGEMFSWRHAVLKSDLPAGVRHVLLTLSCHMTDTGESCYPSVQQLVNETGLSKSSVLAHLKRAALDKWITTARHGYSGQKWARHQYFVSWPDQQKGGVMVAPPSEKGGAVVAPPSPKGGAMVAPPSGPLDRSSTSFPPLISPPTLGSDGCAVPSDTTAETGSLPERIERTARWMLAKIRQLNPDHREPNWKRWHREIGLMVSRDKRTLHEIRDLFGWANADEFWQTNILSPGKLRKQWDNLAIKRNASTGKLGSGGIATDYTCVHCKSVPGVRQVPGIGWLCRVGIEQHESESAHA